MRLRFFVDVNTSATEASFHRFPTQKEEMKPTPRQRRGLVRIDPVILNIPRLVVNYGIHSSVIKEPRGYGQTVQISV